MKKVKQPIIVTGAAGFIGRRVLARLAKEGVPLLAVDRVKLTGTWPRHVSFHQTSLDRPEDLVPAGFNVRAGFRLVHLAWDMRRTPLFLNQSLSVRLLASLLDHWTGHGLTLLVGMGSAEEYGVRSGEIREEEPPELPLSPYGWAKHTAFLMAQLWAAREERGLIWLRPFVVYGEGQGGDMLLPYALQIARRRERGEFTDGLQIRDFVHVDDVAEAIALSALHEEPSGTEVINLGGGDPVAVREILMEIARHFGVEDLFHLGARPRRFSEPEVQIASIERAREFLGWAPTVSWWDGIRRLCEEN